MTVAILILSALLELARGVGIPVPAKTSIHEVLGMYVERCKAEGEASKQDLDAAPRRALERDIAAAELATFSVALAELRSERKYVLQDGQGGLRSGPISGPINGGSGVSLAEANMGGAGGTGPGVQMQGTSIVARRWLPGSMHLTRLRARYVR